MAGRAGSRRPFGVGHSSLFNERGGGCLALAAAPDMRPGAMPGCIKRDSAQSRAEAAPSKEAVEEAGLAAGETVGRLARPCFDVPALGVAPRNQGCT